MAECAGHRWRPGCGGLRLVVDAAQARRQAGCRLIRNEEIEMRME